MQSSYDQTVREFFEGRNGSCILLTEDAAFYKLLRGTIFKILGIRIDCLNFFHEPAQALREVKDRYSSGQPVLIFVERQIQGKSTADFILSSKRLFPEALLIVLTGETSESELIFLHEMGANNIITKPVSVDSLVQKIAFTIKPQGKLNQLVQIGKNYLSKGELKKVLQVCAKILEIKPNSPAGLMLLGDALSGLGKRAEALKAYEKAHAQSKVFIDPIKKLAEFHKGNNNEQYLYYLKKLDKISPLNTERKCEIGRFHLENNQLEEAEGYFDQAVKCAIREAHGYLSEVMSNIAESLFDVAPAKAEKYYSKLLSVKGNSLTTDDLETFNRLGIAMRKQGKWQEAVKNYLEALKVAPREGGLYYNIGLAYTDGKEYTKSAQNFKRAINSEQQVHKASASVARNIAGIFIKVGMKDDARIVIEDALAVFPDDMRLKELQRKLQ